MKCPAFLPLCLAACSLASADVASPFQKVVTLLQDLESKIEAEGDVDKKDIEKYKCWCDKVVETKTKMIAEGRLTVQKADKEVQEDVALDKKLKGEIAATTEQKEDKELSEKQGITVQTEQHNDNVQTIQEGEHLVSDIQSVEAVLDQAGVSFIQVEEHKQKYDPKVASIASILDVQKAQANEEVDTTKKSDIKMTREFNSWLANLKETVGILDTDLAAEKAADAEVLVELAEDTKRKETTAAQVEADSAFLEDAIRSCQVRQEEYANRTVMRQQELNGVGMALKSMNDARQVLDDAFKKQVEAPSFFQIESVDSAVQTAAGVLKAKATKAHSLRLALIASRLQEAQMPTGAFTAVLAEIDKMTEKLKAEAKSDKKKKDYCKVEYQTIAKKSKHSTFLIQKNSAEISKLTLRLEELAADKAAAQKENGEIDEDLQKSAELREEGHRAFKKAVSDDEQAIAVLNATSKNLSQYYDNLPKPTGALLQQAPDRSSDDIKQLANEEHKYTITSDDSQEGAARSILALLDRLAHDLANEITEAKQDEQKAQLDYEKSKALLSSAQEKLLKKITAIGVMESNSADTKGAEESKKEDEEADLKATEDYKAGIKEECDYILENFDERASNRETEMTGLVRAKELLSGAALVQKNAHVEKASEDEDKSSLLKYLGFGDFQ
eukprot:TRINITY_DN29987_c0_g1_i1.p1 TRINITY_DN29987_c0_g1~~TRINITY_DN29987_c0_g1_i1.p1  ORF type:complete len:671 (-),score=221.10 TRINITY_DN29987_c0_g1_i1:43-2055(-)